MLTCSCCNLKKNTSEFYVHKRMSSGFQSRCKDCTKIAAKKSYREDPTKTKVRARERQRLLIARTPCWANRTRMYNIYRTAEKLTQDTGVMYHVDHIIPINSPLVCGLHTDANLQILTAEENMKKSNRLIPEFM